MTRFEQKNSDMEPLFLLSLILYLAGALLAWAAIRPESRRSLSLSAAIYAGGAVTSIALEVWRFALGSGHAPDFIDGALFAQALLALIFLGLRRRVASPGLVASLSFLSFWLGLMALARGSAAIGVERSETALTAAHAYAMFTAFAALSLSCLFAVLFLIQDRLLKKHASLAGWLQVLPPVELSGRLNFWSLMAGTAALAAGAAFGWILAARENRWDFLWRDPAVWLSLLLLGVYGALVGIRFGPLDRLRTSAVLSVVCYGVWILVFLAVHRAVGI